MPRWRRSRIRSRATSSTSSRRPQPPGRSRTAGSISTWAESSKLPAATWKRVWESFATLDYTDELGRIEAPVLIAWGDQDVFVSAADQLYLAGRISNSRVVVYEGSGHSLHWEECERFAAEVTAFVESL